MRFMPPRRTARTAMRLTTPRRRGGVRSGPAQARVSVLRMIQCSLDVSLMDSRLLVTALCVVAFLTPAAAQTPDLATAARGSGTPDIPGLKMIWLAPWGEVSSAHPWRNVIVHQTEGPAGSARSGAQQQAKNPTRRGVTVWVETDGTVYWAVPENLVPTHGDGANRNDN